MAMFELTDLRPSRRTRLHLVFSTVRHPASAFACSSHTLSSSWRSFMVCAVLLSEASMLGCGFIITLLIARLVLLLAGLDYAVTRADALRMAPFGSAVVAIVRLQSYLSSRTAALEAAGWLWRLPGLVIGRPIARVGFVQKVRGLLDWLAGHVRGLLITVAAGALISAILGFATTATILRMRVNATTLQLVRAVGRRTPKSRKPNEPDPGCTESRAILGQLASKDWRQKAHADPSEIRLYLNKANQVQASEDCGFDQPSGFIDVNEEIAILLARYQAEDRQRISDGGHTELTSADWKAIATEPQARQSTGRGLAGLVESAHARNGAVATYGRLQDIQTRTFAGLVLGRGLKVDQFPLSVECGDPPMKGENENLEVQRAGCALEVAIHRKRQVIDQIMYLDADLGRRYLDAGVYGLSGCVFIILLLAMWRQARIRRAKAEIDSQKSAAALSITVLNSRTDEAIRRMALTRIKTLETVSQNDMDNLEEAVGELLTVGGSGRGSHFGSASFVECSPSLSL